MENNKTNGIMPEEWENQERRKSNQELDENFIDPKYNEALKSYLEQNKINAAQMTREDMERIIKKLKGETK